MSGLIMGKGLVGLRGTGYFKFWGSTGLEVKTEFCAYTRQVPKPLDWVHAELGDVLLFLREEEKAGRFKPLSRL